MSAISDFHVAAGQYREARRDIREVVVWWEAAIVAAQAATYLWPQMNKKERSRWRRLSGHRSPQMFLQLAGESTI